MHRPAPGANHEKSEQLKVNIIGDCDPRDDETEVHSNAEPRLWPVCDTLHERVDDETARAKSRKSLNKERLHRQTYRGRS
jgi:hypothetical protein